MPIIKDLTLEATGGNASCHVVGSISLDLLAKTTMATLISFVSEDTYKAGKNPASFQRIIASVEGLPVDNEAPLAFIEAELVKAGTFAGGSVVA